MPGSYQNPLYWLSILDIRRQKWRKEMCVTLIFLVPVWAKTDIMKCTPLISSEYGLNFVPTSDVQICIQMQCITHGSSKKLMRTELCRIFFCFFFENIFSRIGYGWFCRHFPSPNYHLTLKQIYISLNF